MKEPGTALRRRSFLKGIAGAAASNLCAPFIITAQAANSLVVTAYGGEYEDVFMKTVVKPFEKKFGVHIVYDESGGASQTYAKIRAARGAPGFDVAAELTAPEAILGGKEKLLEPVSEKEVPNLKYVWQKSLEAIPPVGVVPYYQYMPLLWNKKKIDKPDSWADYWMPGTKYGDKIKGHLLGHDPASNLLAVYALIMAAKLKGGGMHHMDGAWELLKQQKPWLEAVIQSSAQAAPYFENDEVWLTPVLERPVRILCGKGLSARLHHPEGRHDRPRRRVRGADRCKEQEAGIRVPELSAGPGRAARLRPCLFRQPRAAGHRRLAGRFRRDPDHHAEGDGPA